MTARLRKTRSEIPKRVNEIERKLKRVPEQAHDKFRELTPVDSGRARRNTILRNDTINANYAYAQRLDNGWSDQAPNGMSEPTIQFIKKRVARILGN